MLTKRARPTLSPRLRENVQKLGARNNTIPITIRLLEASEHTHLAARWNPELVQRVRKLLQPKLAETPLVGLDERHDGLLRTDPDGPPPGRGSFIHRRRGC